MTTLPTVTVTRTGGFAGMNDSYTVRPDGTIIVAKRNHPAPVVKKLTADEQKRLALLVTAPSLRAEAASDAITRRTCADGFVFTVVTGSVSARAMDCGTLAKDAPTLWKIVELVLGAAA